MKKDNGYPYNFNLDEIEEMKQYFFREGELGTALATLREIQESYYRNRGKIDRNRPENSHLMDYRMESMMMPWTGTEVPDYFEARIKAMISEVKKQINSKNSGKQEQKPKTLDEILHDPDFCFRWLKESEPPVISDEFRFIKGGKKFKIVAWLEVLTERGYVKCNLNRKDITHLINAKIEGVNFGNNGRIFSESAYRAYDFRDFKGYLASNIPKRKPA